MDARQQIIGTSVVALTIAIVGSIVYFTTGQTTKLPPSGEVGADFGTTTMSGITATGGDYAVNIISDSAAPNYSKPLIFASSVSADAKAALQKQFIAAKAALDKNKGDFNAWIDMAGIRNISGDPAGAKEIWSYVSELWPMNVVSFNNLGNYYVATREYAKAVTNYERAINNKPTDLNAYKALFELYTSNYKQGKGVAEDVLKRGIVANPKSVDLKVLLARRYRSLGQISDARVTYNAAIATARSIGQPNVAAQIEAEAKTL